MTAFMRNDAVKLFLKSYPSRPLPQANANDFFILVLMLIIG